MRAIIGAVLAFALVLLGLCTLYAFVRFGIISRRITRGAKGRLRRPEPEDVAALTGIQPSHDLIEFYRTAKCIEAVEFYLVDGSKDPPAIWPVGEFFPVTARDVREHLKISGPLPGIPIADDMSKGTYFVAKSGAVMLDSPNVRGRRVEVAPSVAAFATFESTDIPPEEDTGVTSDLMQ